VARFKDLMVGDVFRHSRSKTDSLWKKKSERTGWLLQDDGSTGALWFYFGQEETVYLQEIEG
jgi:hypothetical protein